MKPPIEFRAKRNAPRTRASAASKSAVRHIEDQKASSEVDGGADRNVVQPTGSLGRRLGGEKVEGELSVKGSSDLVTGHPDKAIDGLCNDDILQVLKEFVEIGQNASQAAHEAVEAYKIAERAKVLARVKRHRLRKKYGKDL